MRLRCHFKKLSFLFILPRVSSACLQPTTCPLLQRDGRLSHSVLRVWASRWLMLLQKCPACPRAALLRARLHLGHQRVGTGTGGQPLTKLTRQLHYHSCGCSSCSGVDIVTLLERGLGLEESWNFLTRWHVQRENSYIASPFNLEPASPHTGTAIVNF